MLIGILFSYRIVILFAFEAHKLNSLILDNDSVLEAKAELCFKVKRGSKLIKIIT